MNDGKADRAFFHNPVGFNMGLKAGFQLAFLKHLTITGGIK